MSDQSRTILCVDDEPSIINALRRLLRREGYRFLSATSGKEGLDILKENEVQIVVSDQRMPEMSGTEFLARVKEAYPDALRIVLTGYTEVDSITESINKGHIYKFFLKPWNDQNLRLEIKQAFEQHELIKANEQLVNTVVTQNEQLSSINENLESLIEERTMEIALKNQALALSHAILEEVPISIIGVDNGGTIVLANAMARSTFTDGTVDVGKPFSTYFQNDVCQCFESVVENGEDRMVDIDLEPNKPTRISISPLHGNQGKTNGAIITMMTEQGKRS
jgi:CheY-like chemotaxis protein